MKKLHLGYLALLLLLFTACEEKERTFPEFGDDDVQTGAFARMIDGVNGLFDFFDPNNSEINFTVEFYDVNQGQDVAEYNWTATYINNGDGDNVGPVEILKVPASEFGTSDFGLPSAEITFNLSETLDALGLDSDDINGGDAIRYEATIVLDDGREFTRNNTGGNVISGAAFRGTFIIDQTIVCPSDLGGTYAFTNEITETWPDGCEPQTITGMVTFTEDSEGSYELDDFSFGGYTACYGSGDPAGSLRFLDACNMISATGVDSFGDAYTISDLVVDGTDLTFTWRSAYGEVGRVTIVRPEGWPDLVAAG